MNVLIRNALLQQTISLVLTVPHLFLLSFSHVFRECVKEVKSLIASGRNCANRNRCCCSCLHAWPSESVTGMARWINTRKSPKTTLFLRYLCLHLLKCFLLRLLTLKGIVYPKIIFYFNVNVRILYYIVNKINIVKINLKTYQHTKVKTDNLNKPFAKVLISCVFYFFISGLYIPYFVWLRTRRMEGDHSGAAEKV